MVLRRSLVPVLLFALFSSLAAAQPSGVKDRITQAINESTLTILKGNTHPLARTDFDRGSAPPDLPLDRMMLVLQRTPKQEIALKSLLDEQQDKSSPNYHAWLTPEQFGQEFGSTEQDIQTIESWLGSHGFQVNRVARGRGSIEFSGTARQLQEAFHTAIHKYEVQGKVHWANSADPEIPTALTPVVAGILTLHNFPRKPLYRTRGAFSRRDRLFSGGGNCGLGGSACNALAPYDFATIYNVLPLWNAASPIDGTGETIAIVSQSDIYPQDFSDFRKDFGLPPGTLSIIHNGPDPGKLASQGDELESDLDVEWSGAVAKGAKIDLVVSASTNSSAGVDLSAEYIVDNNLAPIMSESYGACELDLGTAGNLFFKQLWQQAAAEGISVFVATGDSGSAVCDRNSFVAARGLSISGVSSTPYNTAVGGTDFNDWQNPAAYWNSSNDPVTHASAKSYIPEATWNDTCTNSEFFVFTGDTSAEANCNDNASFFWPNFLVPVGGSGGASNCTVSAGQSVSSCSGGYEKPHWQTGSGVPNDGKRDLPDVSLFAADGLNGNFYVVCETDIYGGCAGDANNVVAIGGTSASAPAFAGIMAMINQKAQSRQGNANYVLYALAAHPGASCNSSGSVASTCIFYDVTAGTIAMPCVTGSPDCVTSTGSDLNGVLPGYSTTAGYDLATGLGSVNVTNLVNNWDAVSFQPTVSTLALNPTQITHGAPVNLSVSVAPKTGTGVPSGLVSLLTSKGQPAGIFTLENGSVSGTTGLLPGGSYMVAAHYAGDGRYAASDSSPGIAVAVNPEPSITTVQAFTLDHDYNAVPFSSGPYGGAVVYLRASVAGKSGQGVPTGKVNFTQTLSGATTNLAGDPYSLNNEGYTMTPLPGDYSFFNPGIYSIAARYNGDSSFNANTSPTISFTITRASTSTSTNVIPCSSGTGTCILGARSPVTIFASVLSNTSAFSQLPTGTITFYSNGTPLTSPVILDSAIVPPVASFSTDQLPLGLDNITAQYSGDANYSGSTSAVTVIDVGGTFAIDANPATITVASPGQSGSTKLTFTAQNGLTGSTILSPMMCSNLPPQSSCNFNPTTVAFTSTTTIVPVTLTITTTGPTSTAGLGWPYAPGSWRRSGEIAVGLIGMCVVLLCTNQRRCPRPVLAFVCLGAITFMISCGGAGSEGGGGTSGGGGGGGNPGTPAGNYTGVTVTVSIGGITQSINNLSVNVQ